MILNLVSSYGMSYHLKMDIILHLYQRTPKLRLLETRYAGDVSLSNYFIEEFGDDGNLGTDNAMNYVKTKYGGGKYQLQVFEDSKLLQTADFEISWHKDKESYVSPFTGRIV